MYPGSQNWHSSSSICLTNYKWENHKNCLRHQTFVKYLVSSGYLIILFYLSINTLSFNLMTSTYFDSFPIPIIRYATIVSACQVQICTMKKRFINLNEKIHFSYPINVYQEIMVPSRHITRLWEFEDSKLQQTQFSTLNHTNTFDYLVSNVQ